MKPSMCLSIFFLQISSPMSFPLKQQACCLRTDSAFGQPMLQLPAISDRWDQSATTPHIRNTEMKRNKKTLEMVFCLKLGQFQFNKTLIMYVVFLNISHLFGNLISSFLDETCEPTKFKPRSVCEVPFTHPKRSLQPPWR